MVCEVCVSVSNINCLEQSSEISKGSFEQSYSITQYFWLLFKAKCLKSQPNQSQAFLNENDWGTVRRHSLNAYVSTYLEVRQMFLKPVFMSGLMFHTHAFVGDGEQQNCSNSVYGFAPLNSIWFCCSMSLMYFRRIINEKRQTFTAI